ncbi:U3 small nucleolar RNA-associated protein 25, partial [Bienertia sinuspersici]
CNFVGRSQNTPATMASVADVPLCTPGGTKERIPCFSTNLNPKATITKSKKGDVAFKYFLCNKAGFKEKRKTQVVDNLKHNEGGDVVVQSSSISRKRLKGNGWIGFLKICAQKVDYYGNK